jgi:hypothetical protein
MSISSRFAQIISEAVPIQDGPSDWNEQAYDLALYLSHHNKWYDAKATLGEIMPSFRQNLQDPQVSQEEYFVYFMVICMKALVRLINMHVMRAGLALENKGYCVTYIYPIIAQFKELFWKISNFSHVESVRESCEDLAPDMYRIFNDVYNITNDWKLAEETLGQYRESAKVPLQWPPSPPVRDAKSVITREDLTTWQPEALAAHKKAMYQLQSAKMNYAFCKFVEAREQICPIIAEITNTDYLSFSEVQTWVEASILHVKILISLVTEVGQKRTSRRSTHSTFKDVNGALKAACKIVSQLICTQMAKDGSNIWRKQYKDMMLRKIWKLHAEVHLREAVLMLKRASKHCNKFRLDDPKTMLDITEKTDKIFLCMANAQKIDDELEQNIEGISLVVRSANEGTQHLDEKQMFVYNQVERACCLILVVYVYSRVSDDDNAWHKYESELNKARTLLQRIVSFNKISQYERPEGAHRSYGQFEQPGWEPRIHGFTELFLAHACQLQNQHEEANKHMLSYVMRCVSFIRNRTTENRSCFACGKRILKQKVSCEMKQPTWCSKCYVVQYCCKECQKYDFKRIEDGGNWSQPGGHGLFCEMFGISRMILEFYDLLEPLEDKTDDDSKSTYDEISIKIAVNLEYLKKLIKKYLEDGPSKIATRNLTYDQKLQQSESDPDKTSLAQGSQGYEVEDLSDDEDDVLQDDKDEWEIKNNQVRVSPQRPNAILLDVTNMDLSAS